MARRVFFSFHYQRDIWRVAQVRNHWISKPDRETAGYIDAAAWEQLKLRGEHAVRNWIDSQLQGTSVTVVLIGAETHTRKWVNYEIEQSYALGKGLLGVHIHSLQDSSRRTDRQGVDPLSKHYGTDSLGRRVPLSNLYSTYDWVRDRGYFNFADWVESAAKGARR